MYMEAREKSHSVVNVTILMSAVKYMWCICRARVIVFNVPPPPLQYFKFKHTPLKKRIFTVCKIYYSFSEASSSWKMMFSRLWKSEK